MSHKRSASAGDHPSMLKRCSNLTEEHRSEVDNLFSKRFCYSQVTKAYYLDGGKAGNANFDKETKATTVEDYLGGMSSPKNLGIDLTDIIKTHVNNLLTF